MSDQEGFDLIEAAMADVRVVVCPKCAGEGVLRHALGHQCPTCNGSGKTTEGATMGRYYPEHEKLAAIKDRSEAIGAFLDNSGYTLCEWLPPTDGNPEGGYSPVRGGIQQILAHYFKIDLEVLEQEKRAMLEEARGEL